MRPHATHATRLPGRAGIFRCNICQELCASDQALREHYHQRHPEAAAEIDRLQARLTGQDVPHH